MTSLSNTHAHAWKIEGVVDKLARAIKKKRASRSHVKLGFCLRGPKRTQKGPPEWTPKLTPYATWAPKWVPKGAPQNSPKVVSTMDPQMDPKMGLHMDLNMDLIRPPQN